MNQQTESESSLAERADIRASFYNFLNIHFQELPDEQFIRSVRSEHFCSVLDELKSNGEFRPGIAAGAALMRKYLGDAVGRENRELSEELGRDRTRLYRSVTPQTELAPPYEALWAGKGKDTELLHELVKAYRESGFALKEDVHDRPDYIGIELDFMERLVTKEISARETGEEEMLQAVLEDERDFLVNHLGAWVPGFVAAALGQAQTDFYRGHLHMINGFLVQELGLFNQGETSA